MQHEGNHRHADRDRHAADRSRRSPARSTIVVPFWVTPQITNAKLTTVPRQTKVNTNFTATGIPAPTLTLTGTLPKGLTFKSGTGTAKLSGTVNAAGTYPLTLTATSSAGSTHKTYMLHVTAPRVGVAGRGAAGEQEGNREVGAARVARRPPGDRLRRHAVPRAPRHAGRTRSTRPRSTR